MLKSFPVSIVFLFILFTARSYSQPSLPAIGPVYNDQTVPRIDILIDPDSLAEIYDHVDSDHEFPATFIFQNGTIQDTVTDIGFRLRGGTSRYSNKKSFKVSFNTFVQGRKYYGLEKMNLNGEHNDPSVIRSKLCWDLFRKFNVPGARANHVGVYINNSFYGLYISVEDLDDCFVKSRFGNNNGNLFKCLYPADLAYLGNNPNAYKFTANNRRAYELQTNQEIDDYTDLAHFIDVLNNTPLSQLKCELDKVFNVNDYLKAMAVDLFTGQWDGYAYNKNNFFLYHNLASGKFEYISYDLDNTYGIDWMGIDWATRNLYNWSNTGENRPLYTRILAVQEYKDKFSYYFQELLDSVTNTAYFFPRIDSLMTMIRPYVSIDPYYPQDYGYTLTDFDNSYTQALWGHVTYGIKPYITARRSAASSQLVVNNILPVIKYLWSNHPRIGQQIILRAFSEDDDPNLGVRLKYSINQAAMDSVGMFDDGLHFDFFAGDHIYAAVLPPLSAAGVIDYQVAATDNTGKRSVVPCQPAQLNISESGRALLYINEFMADNTHTIADEAGEYDDWLEIFNGDTIPVWLGDKYLTDDLADPQKWLMPDFTMQPGSFSLFWADQQTGQGPFHADFKIKKEGEELGIFEGPSIGTSAIDSIKFGLQTSDVSFGRLMDGGPDWVPFALSTPGFSNVFYGTGENPENNEEFRIYPNPNNTGTLFFSEPVSFGLYNLMGIRLIEGEKTSQADISELKTGLYLIHTETGKIYKLLRINR